MAMQEDQTARKRYTPEERERIVAAYRKSQMTQREFAAQAGISLSCLSLWLKKSKKGSPAGFIEVSPSLPKGWPQLGSYRIESPGGWSLEVGRGFEGEELTRLCQIVKGL
jgi:hypothetical protein